MFTSDGKECPYYYANFHRRTSAVERCDLLVGGPYEQNWHSDLCKTCPVPEIKRANNCPTMQLKLRIIKRGIWFWERDRVLVQATCTQHDGPVTNPMIGCGKCHTQLTFVVGTDKQSE